MDTETATRDAGREAARWAPPGSSRWEDLRQDALLAMWQWSPRVDASRPEHERRGYLRRVARSAIVSRLRKDGRTLRTATLDIAEDAPRHEIARIERALGIGTASPEDHAQAIEVAEALASAVEKVRAETKGRAFLVARGEADVTQRASNYAREAIERRLVLALREAVDTVRLDAVQRRALTEMAVAA